MEVIFVVLVGQLVELCLVRLELLDKVHEVARFLEFLKVLGINHVAKLILNANDEFDCIKWVQSVACEKGVEVNTSFFGGSEVVANYRKHIFLNLILAWQHKGVLCVFDLSFPEVERVSLFGLSLHNGESIRVKTKVAVVASDCSNTHNGTGAECLLEKNFIKHF